jgi:hypothetical protein
VISNYVTATEDPPIYTTSLAAGQSNRLEYRTDGFNAFVTRTVKDAGGNVILFDQFSSHYSRVNGLLEIGGSPPGQVTPPPSAPPSAPPSDAPPTAAPPSAPPATDPPTPVPSAS